MLVFVSHEQILNEWYTKEFSLFVYSGVVVKWDPKYIAGYWGCYRKSIVKIVFDGWALM